MEKGRPTKYKEEYNEQAYKLCLLGAIDEDIADFFEVNVDTIYEWKKVYKEFSESIKRGKIEADLIIVDSLYQRAKGMTITIQQAHKVKVDKFIEEVQIVDLKQELPPDTTSMIFWLKNRRPKQWRDKQEIEQKNTNINYNTELSKDEIKEINEALEKEV